MMDHTGNERLAYISWDPNTGRVTGFNSIPRNAYYGFGEIQPFLPRGKKYAGFATDVTDEITTIKQFTNGRLIDPYDQQRPSWLIESGQTNTDDGSRITSFRAVISSFPIGSQVLEIARDEGMILLDQLKSHLMTLAGDSLCLSASDFAKYYNT